MDRPTAPTFGDSMRELATRAHANIKSLRKVHRQANELSSNDGLGDLLAAATAVENLQQLQSDQRTTRELAEVCEAQIRAQIDARRHSLRMELQGELWRAAEDAHVPVEMLSATPLVVALDPISATIDFDSAMATLSYARQPLAKVPATASAIIAGRGEALDALAAAATDSVTFFDRLAKAYATVCTARDVAFGARIDLVDVLAPLSLLGTEPSTWRRPSKNAFSPIPRALLAYQLDRLRRDGCLERNGRRIDLGTATGGTARRKLDVLYVPSNPSEGQFYLSLRFTGGR